VEKVYIIARLYTPFYKAFKENKFYHTGSPAYYNFIKFIDNKTDIDYEIIFLGDKTNSLLFQNKSYKLENLNKPIKFIPYKNIFSNNKFVKIEIILNKLYQYFYLIKTLKSNCIYYIDRENIPLGLFLKFKKGLICYRVLGITQKVYNILFKRNDLVNYIFKKSLNLKNAIIISSNDGSWAEKTKKEIENKNFYLLFNGVDYKFLPKSLENKKTFTISYISRLEEGKGHFDFLNIIKGVVEKGISNIKINIIGDGNLKNEIIKKAKDYNIYEYINFTNSINHQQIELYLEKTDLLVSLNYFGILGNNVLEATSKSIPILALDNENVSEEYKKYFYLIKKNNLQEGITFICNLIESPNVYKEYINKSQIFFNTHISNWDERISKEFNIIKNQYLKLKDN